MICTSFVWVLKSLFEFFHPISLVSVFGTTTDSHTTHLVPVWWLRLHIHFCKTLSLLFQLWPPLPYLKRRVCPCPAALSAGGAAPAAPYSRHCPLENSFRLSPPLRHERLSGYSGSSSCPPQPYQLSLPQTWAHGMCG